MKMENLSDFVLLLLTIYPHNPSDGEGTLSAKTRHQSFEHWVLEVLPWKKMEPDDFNIHMHKSNQHLNLKL